MAQINPTVGAIEANADKMIEIITTHQPTHDLIVFPELALTGYPPEDILLRDACEQRVRKALSNICHATQNTHVVIGHPHQKNSHRYNALSVIHQGNIIANYQKQHLPNTGVFDEKRYFEPGPKIPCILTIKNQTIGFCICEDIWRSGPVEQIIQADANLLVCINASPFETEKTEQRIDLFKSHTPNHLTFVYVNLVGAQDELVFDGQSFVCDASGQIKAQAPAFTEHLTTVQIYPDQTIQSDTNTKPTHEMALIYKALCTGLYDYVTKNNFPGVLLGLSGGIDSALTLALAVDALGAERVHALALPSRYTADISMDDLNKMLEIHQLDGIQYHTISIEPGFKALLETLEPNLAHQTVPDIAQQNLQARLRGMILMAFSNSNQKLLLSTSNKTESAIGYTTLYGDMCGGFAPIQDVPKMLVYALAAYRNTISPVIPLRVITRAPSAELAENQTDQDTLPDYPELDQIIAYYMNEKHSTEEIIAKGHAADVVKQVIQLIKRSEYKRRQAPPGTKISHRAFGRDWRYPITSKF
jgi:NAD+ synthase (glutamine-hydrolysing)